jgi:hypothetical protein
MKLAFILFTYYIAIAQGVYEERQCTAAGGSCMLASNCAGNTRTGLCPTQPRNVKWVCILSVKNIIRCCFNDDDSNDGGSGDCGCDYDYASTDSGGPTQGALRYHKTSSTGHKVAYLKSKDVLLRMSSRRKWALISRFIFATSLIFHSFSSACILFHYNAILNNTIVLFCSMARYFSSKFGGRYEIYANRNIRGSSTRSLHGEGRAVDLYVSGSTGRKVSIVNNTP